MPNTTTSRTELIIAGTSGEKNSILIPLSLSQVSTEIPAGKARLSAISSKLRVELALNDSVSTLHQWWKAVCDPKKPLEKRIVDVRSYDSSGKLTNGWRFHNAWPCKIGVGPVGHKKKSQTACEFFELVYEECEKIGVDREVDHASQVTSEGSDFDQKNIPDSTSRYGKRINIKGSPVFVSKMKQDLTILASIPTGARLLVAIDKLPHDVTITHCSPGGEEADPGPPPNEDLINGVGKPVNVRMSGQRFRMYRSTAGWESPSTATILGHELIHAQHMASGTMAGIDYVGGPMVPNDPENYYFNALEERRTVGLGKSERHGFPDFSKEPFTENKIRAELGEPPRTSYQDPRLDTW